MKSISKETEAALFGKNFRVVSESAFAKIYQQFEAVGNKPREQA